MPHPHAQSEAILAAASELEQLTRKRLAWAQNGQWDALLASEERRGRLAEAIDAARLDRDSPETEALARRLTRIREMDRAIQPFLEAERDRLNEERQKVSRKSAGARAYQQVERGRD
ncbi:MAG: flagellar protein FliT [Ectothiorhodospira sp.]